MSRPQAKVPSQRLKKPKDVSMTPDTFQRSKAQKDQMRLKKKALRRKSFNGDETQIMADDTDMSDGSFLDESQTPLTLSQISAIAPPDNDTLTTTFAKGKKRRAKFGSDSTLEMAVHYARGEPDGAEGNRSFTREQIAQLSLDDSTDQDHHYNDVEMVSDKDVSPSPAKKHKALKEKADNTPVKKEKKSKLKLPFKKTKPSKVEEDSKGKKKSEKNFEKLPDETQVPETPTKTWKEKRKERKMVKNNYQVITEAKRAWEDLRKSDLTPVKRKKICDDLMRLVVGKVKSLCKVHDSARVIQCLVQFGNDSQRAIIFEEIKDEVCDMCKIKYAKYVVRKLIHYGSKDLKGEIFKCFNGQIKKMIRHKEASDILEYAYNEFATQTQRLAILEEFYGPAFALFKDRVHQSLDQIMSNQPEKKNMVVRSMKECLEPLIDKEILIHSLVHKVFYDFFTYADEKSKKEIIEGLRENIPHLVHTRDGTRVAMQCIWYGSTKDRRVIIKSLKGHIVKLCQEEHGHMLLMAVMDAVDDTVLVHKAVLNEMMRSLDTVLESQHGRKVIVYLLNPRDPVHCHPDIVKVLRMGDGNPSSKKDSCLRSRELLGAVSPALLAHLAAHAGAMMRDSHLALLVRDIITHATGDVAPCMRAIAACVAAPAQEGPEGALAVVEHPAAHIALKKIIANDKVRMERGDGILFSAILLESLSKSTVKAWAASNRGCFILVSLIEVNCSTITDRVRDHIQPVRKSLSKMTFKGAELLLQKLDQGREYRV